MVPGKIKKAELAFEELLVSGETDPGIRMYYSLKCHLAEDNRVL